MKRKYLYAIVLTSIIGAILLILYLTKFHYGLSDSHGTWGEFGSFFGGIISPLVAVLAFITVLYSLDLTKKQFKKNSDNSTFFSLIELHSKKVASMTYSISNKADVLSFHAFKLYTDDYNKFAYDELRLLSRRLFCNDINSIGYKGFNFLWMKLSVLTEEFLNQTYDYKGEASQNQRIIDYFNETEDKWELVKFLIGSEDKTTDDDNQTLEHIGLNYIMDSESEVRVRFIQRVHDFFYQEYGHVLGHYFRNIHYVLEHVNDIKSSKKYGKIFRAQLSRYELALMYYNSLSSMSSKKHVKLLLKYDVFNGLYATDLFYGPDKKTENNDLAFRLNMENAP